MSASSGTWARPLIAALAIVVTAAGCSKKHAMAPVHGQITFDGKPVAYGSIMFQHESGGQPAVGEIKADGSYELDTFGVGAGARVGPNLVRITSFEGNDPSRKMALPSGEKVLGKALIPSKYGSFGSSGLRVEVTSEGDQKFDFKLEK